MYLTNRRTGLTFLVGIALWSLPASASAQQDDGFTYRIGECNPYNDEAWRRYYKGVQSGSPVDQLYNTIRARYAQAEEDSAYTEQLRQQFEEDRARFNELNNDYNREVRDYNNETREYQKEQEDFQDQLTEFRENPPGSSPMDEARINRKKELADWGRDLKKWKDDLNNWSGELNDKFENLQQIRQDLNKVVRQIDNYVKGADQNIQQYQQLSNTYQLLRIRRQDNRRHAG
jgi:chromosome segregation ATPase